MKLNVFLIASIALLLLSKCCLANDISQTEQEKLKKIKQSVRIYTIEKFKFLGTYSPYSFGELVTIKPKEIIEYDQLLSLQAELPKLEENYGEKLDSVIAENNSRIASKKQEIRDNKIYHYYKIDHLFIIREKKGADVLYEIDFQIYPNLKIKDVSIQLKTKLTAEKKDLFVYFIEQFPLVEDEDPYIQKEINTKLHQQLSDALANETVNKEAVFHQVLNIVKFIRKHNQFDADLFCANQVKKWIKKNEASAYNLNYRPGKFTRLKLTNDTVINGNSIMYHRFRFQSKSSSMKQTALSFEFDPNYLFVEIIEYKKDFDQFFD